MDFALFFRILLPVISFIAAFFLVRKFRSTIRGFVMWCIPVRLRISEESYQLQTRYATLLSFLLTFLLAGLFYYGLYRGQKALGWTVSSSVQLYSTVPSLPRKVMSSPTPKPTPPPEQEQPVEPTVPEMPTRIPVAPEPAKRPGIPTTRRAATPKPAPAKPLTAQFYLQVAAYTYLDNATDRQAQWQRKTTQLVWIAVAQEPAPYKLLIGPFTTKKSAKKYQNQQRKVGFVRSGNGLQFFTK